ncbi:MAG: TIGR02265 family protein [Myxococcota bacterium]|nr:TIGR02265 family protein [Myxococcota bacterium]
MNGPATQHAFSATGANLALCYAHTDLEWRLANIPIDATCRGAFFNMLDDRAGSLSSATQAEYRAFFRIHRFSAFRMYPVRDYVTRIVVLAQIHYGAESIYRGIRELQSGAFDAWAKTLLGRAALAVVSPELPSMLRMLARAYASQTVVSHSRFAVESATDREIVVRLENEHLYIEHAMVGALEGVARVCGVPGAQFVVELDGPFDGTIRILLPDARVITT